MKKIFTLALGSVAALALAACTQNAQNETGEAANAVGTDIENTADAGAASVDNALDSAGASMDNAADATANAADNAGEATANALDNDNNDGEPGK